MRTTVTTALATAAVAFSLQSVPSASLMFAASEPPSPAQFQPQDTLRPRGGERAVQQIATRIRNSAEALRRSADDLRGRNTGAGAQQRDDIRYAVDDLVSAVDYVANQSSRNQVVAADLDDVRGSANAVDDAVRDASTAANVRNAWTALQRDLEALSSAFGQPWNWRDSSSPSASAGSSLYQLRGTYELDSARSDNPTRTLNQAMRQQGANRRGRVRQDLEARLNPPSRISIDRSGNEVTLASSDAPRVTFDASGRAVSERRGARNATLRASAYGDRLEVTTTGAGADDYTVTFEPVDGGRTLNLTRQIHGEGLSQPVVVRSVYRRTSEWPDWNITDARGRDVVGTSGNFGGAIADGTLLTATLDAPVDLRSVRENDRVALTVRNAPEARLENAVLEGYVSSVPSDTDRAGFGVVFNRLRLTNGRSADFDGSVQSVRGPNGEAISFDGERVDNDDQREQAIQRGAVGAAIGAIVGAIAGGGKGAAIGAAVGAGGGAATVLINGERRTELPRGTEFTIRSEGSSGWDR